MLAFLRAHGQTELTSFIQRFLGCLAPLVTLLAGHDVLAQPPDPGEPPDRTLAVWVGQSRSDNLGRTEIPQSGSYDVLGFMAGLERESTRLEANIDADIEYRNYSLDTYDNETVGTLDAGALVDLVDDRVAWNFEGSLDQGQLDPFRADGPGNRETISVLTHGPQFTFPFGRNSFNFGAQQSRRRYDESAQIDNDNDHYELGISRRTSPITTFGLFASADQTEYADAFASEYDIDKVFVRVEKEFANGELTADVGTNEISSANQSHRDPLVLLALTRALGTRSELSISAGQEFTDAGSQIQAPLDGIGAPGNVIVTTAPFERESLSVGYELTHERTRFFVRLGTGEEDYAAGPNFDNEFDEIVVTLDYRLSQRLDIGLVGDLYERDFAENPGAAGGEEDVTIGAWLSWDLGRRFAIAVGTSRYEHSGDVAVDDSRSEIRFSYSPTGSMSTTLRSIGR